MTKVLHETIKKFMKRDSGPYTVMPLKGGANNQVFKIECENGSSYLVKKYFSHEQDPRDRIRNEFSFSKYLWDRGVRTIPEPFYCDFPNNIAIYEYLEGEKIRQNQVAREHVRQAAEFFRTINNVRQGADCLNNASEACFSLDDHFTSVERRLSGLVAIEPKTETDAEALEFITTDLSETWNETKKHTMNAWLASGLSDKTPVAAETKRLSPSDFGFHNSFLMPDNTLKFFDFEYAGWDSPVKMVCDFFCQPEVPVPMKYCPFFSDMVLEDLTAKEQLRRSILLLFPIYQIKWCCIMLNEFLPVGKKRRQFSGISQDFERKKREQLSKAKKTFRQLRYTDIIHDENTP